MKLTEAEMRMVFQIESTNQNAALNEIYMTWRYGRGDRGTLHQLARTGLRRGHAGAFRGGSGHHGVSGLRVYLFPIHGR